jgi:hypothetical protein
MNHAEANHTLAVLSAVLAVVTLPAAAAIPILTLLIGYLAGHYTRRRD